MVSAYKQIQILFKNTIYIYIYIIKLFLVYRLLFAVEVILHRINQSSFLEFLLQVSKDELAQCDIVWLRKEGSKFCVCLPTSGVTGLQFACLCNEALGELSDS